MKKQTTPTPEDLSAKRATAQIIYDRLVALHGEQPLIPRREPMHELISTILSHRTTAANEKTAYQTMRARFGDWAGVRDAPLPDLIDAIATSNYPEVKAPYIKGVLTEIYNRRGDFSLDFLRDTPTDEALQWLMSMPGVGIKTATLVLLFCFHKPVMPVDTHVHRVAQRVGLIGPKIDPTAAHPILAAILPPDPFFLYNYHVANLRHGQRICIWRDPKCEECPLTDICAWYQANRAPKTASATA